MQFYTMWELFSRDHRGWLVSRFWRGKHVLKGDIERVLESDPDALSEPIVVALLDAPAERKTRAQTWAQLILLWENGQCHARAGRYAPACQTV